MREYDTLPRFAASFRFRSEEHTSELQSRENLVCRLLLEKKKNTALMMALPSPNTSYSSLSSAIDLLCSSFVYKLSSFFFFNDTATTEIYTLSLHDALPI